MISALFHRTSQPVEVKQTITHLPDVLLKLIFSYSKAPDLGRFITGSSKNLRSRIQKYDKLWEPIAKRLWGFNEKPKNFSWRDCVIIHQQWKKNIYQESSFPIPLYYPDIAGFFGEKLYLKDSTEIIQWDPQKKKFTSLVKKQIAREFYFKCMNEEGVVLGKYNHFNHKSLYSIIDKNGKVIHLPRLFFEHDPKHFIKDHLIFQNPHEIKIYNIKLKKMLPPINGTLLNFKNSLLYILKNLGPNTIDIYDLELNTSVEQIPIPNVHGLNKIELRIDKETVLLLLFTNDKIHGFELLSGAFEKKWEMNSKPNWVNLPSFHHYLFPQYSSEDINYYKLYNLNNGKKIGNCHIETHNDLTGKTFFDFHSVTYLQDKSLHIKDFSPVAHFPETRIERIKFTLDNKCHKILGNQLYETAKKTMQAFKKFILENLFWIAIWTAYFLFFGYLIYISP